MTGRPKQNQTDESANSISSSLAGMINLTARAVDNLTERFHDPAAMAQDLLHRMLSIQSHISPASTLARTYEMASATPAHQVFKEIGRGTCGKVFALVGAPKVAKVPVDSSQWQRLYNDFCMHKLVEESFSVAPSEYSQALSVPRLEEWVAPDALDFWKEYGPRFPGQRPSFCLVSERIFPLPAPIRQALFRSFAPPRLNEQEFLTTDTNKDCLVRVYMGRRMKGSRKEAKSFGLRNFELHVNEMETLGLPLDKYATIMANAYAILHWKAQIDADDVEFVLGSSPLSKKCPNNAQVLFKSSPLVSHRSGSDFDYHRRSIGMWLLDFNNCQRVTMDARGVEMLVKAFWHNDPYTPRPSGDHDIDVELWHHFRETYLNTSRGPLSKEHSHLPQLFIDGVEAEGKKWKARRAMAGEGSLFAAIAK
ncbi:hypothetical protein MMC13_002867 [Lambiella insularis]|nr:hypothetical protein [Lambiella insularis]